jgi:hypothetical protein
MPAAQGDDDVDVDSVNVLSATTVTPCTVLFPHEWHKLQDNLT